MGCHALLQGIFPTQWSNPHLLYLLLWQVGFLFIYFLPLAPPGKALFKSQPCQIAVGIFSDLLLNTLCPFYMFSFFTLIRLPPASLSPTPINIKLTFQALKFYLLFKVSLRTPVFTNYPFLLTLLYQGFPDSSVDKESTCNAGDSSSIPG